MSKGNLTRGISLKRQNYLETIYDLCRENGSASTKSIAEKMQIKMPSVTEAVKNLSEKGLVNYSARKAITLTAKGLQVASELERKHSVLEDFFLSIGCNSEQASKTACLVEHDIDFEISAKLAKVSAALKSGKITI